MSFDVAPSLSPEQRQMVNAQLGSGEKMKWFGQPIPSRFARQALPIAFFGIFWTAFAVFWTCGAAGFQIPDFRSPERVLFPLFGLAFILVGLAMLSAPYTMRCKAKSILYVLTNKRAIIFEDRRGRSVRSFRLEVLHDVQRKEHADGSGDIIFGESRARMGDWSSMFRQWPRGGGGVEIGFVAIPRVRDVEKLFREATEEVSEKSGQ